MFKLKYKQSKLEHNQQSTGENKIGILISKLLKRNLLKNKEWIILLFNVLCLL